MAQDIPKKHGFGGGSPAPLDSANGEGPGGFRNDANNVPIPTDEPETKTAKKKAEEPKTQ